ncbi:Protein dispatched 3 [Liparis tanakae]|uniref:Protein dispatched 3 n=1 Tax=Liparis tanakae TaxID=230148 RepID=A0A4Z2GCU0_9TELE|nr:Protein dispatched 3 [Liparis tanakae]
MDVEDEPLLFQTSWGGEDEEEEEEEEDGVTLAAGQRCSSGEAGECGLWRAVGWVYTQPWASGVVLGLVVSLPCALFAYMLLYCPPLDIDLSYSAFEVHSHFSAERFDALTIAVKTQLGSWDRRRRDSDTGESEALRDLLMERLSRQGAFNRTGPEGPGSPSPQSDPLDTGDDQKRGASESRDKRTALDLSLEEMGMHNNSNQRAAERPWEEDLIRRRRFAPNYYLQSQALWRIELVFVAQGEGDRNIFTPERLQTIHGVERLLMQHPQFHQFCWKPLEMLRDLPLGPSYCSPPSSILSYLYPSERGGKIYYDGMGPDLADIEGSLSLAITHPQFYWYVDESLSPEHLSSSLLRSEIHFGAPLPSFYSTQDRAHEQRALFKNFVVQYAEILAKQSTSQVKVLYGGTELFDDEIPAVHDFGLFMALIVSCCWLWVSALMPAALCIWTECVEPQEHVWLNCWRLFSGLSTSHGPLSDEDDDVALLSVAMEPGACDADGDVAILSLSVETSRAPPGQRHVGVVSTNLRWALKHVVAEPVVGRRKVVLGVFLLVLLSSAGFCCLLRPATHAPVLFRRDTNLQTLLALRSNLSGQGISCPMCSGVFMEKPHLLYGHASSSAFKFSTRQQTQSTSAFSSPRRLGKPNASTNQTGSLLTVFISKLDLGASTTIYRFSLNTSTPSPWKRCSTEHQEVSSFQAYNQPRGNYTSRMTACVSHVYHPYPSWMITSASCEPHHGWTPEFSFYVASSPQQHSRRLCFAQRRLRPHPSRVCVSPPGCGLSSGPDGPTQGTFYIPLPSDLSSAAQMKSSKTFGFNPCSGGACGRPAVRPLVDTGAMVFVVFGILGVNRTENRDNHVIADMGSIILDPDFDIFQEMGLLCKICKAISANTQLVKPGGAQCLPSGDKLSSVLPLLHPECASLPEPNLLPGQLSHGAVGLHGGKIRWLSMAFESTTYKGKSSFQTYSDFLQWENFLQEQLASLPASSALQRGFQTCEHWKQIFMEIIGE